MERGTVGRSPRFSLEAVREAAKGGRVQLGGRRCRDELLAHIDELIDCMRFAERVVGGLTENDFAATIKIGATDYDEFGVRVSDALMDEFGVLVRSWYVKVTLVQDDEEVFVLSLHPLERPLDRVGGVLKPERREP